MGVERYDAPELEDNIRDYWDSIDLDKTLSEEKKGARKMYSVHLPQLLTEKMNIKDVYTSILYDIITRHHFMNNYDIIGNYGLDPFTLSIEKEVLGSQGYEDIDRVTNENKGEFIDKCLDLSADLREDDLELFKKIGLLFDMNGVYDTSKEDYIDSLWSRLNKLSEESLLYKKESMLPWCPTCGSSLSRLEIETRTETKETNLVKIPSQKSENRFYLVEIEEPWKLLGMESMAVFPDKEYCVISYEFNGKEEKSIVLKEKLSDIKDDLEIEGYKIVNSVPGKKLEGMSYKNPLSKPVPYLDELNKKSSIILSDNIPDSATGIAPIYPSMDKGSYELGQEYDLPSHCPIDGEGYVRSEEEFGRFAGYHITKSSNKVLDYLKKEGFLIARYEDIKENEFCIHSFSEIIYRFDEEWFLKVSDLEFEIEEMIEDIEWAPKKYKLDEIKKRIITQDLHITRRNGWGIPFPMWTCECGNDYVPESIESFFEVIGKDVGIEELLEIENIEVKCSECGKLMTWEEKVLNPMFVSSTSPFSQLGHIRYGDDFQDIWPGDLAILNKGKDDAVLLGLLTFSAAFFEKPSVKKIIETGEIKHGKHDDLDFDENIDSLRLRLLRGHSIYDDFNLQDIQNEDTDRLIRVLWNVYSFSLSLMKDNNFDPQEMTLDSIQKYLDVEELWLLSKTESLIESVEGAYEVYNFDEVIGYLEEFVLKDFAQWYFSIYKTKLDETGEKEILSIMKVIHHALITVSKLLSPIAPFTSEEIYQKLEGKFDSVFLCERPVVNKMLIDHEIEEDMGRVQNMVENIIHGKIEADLPEKWPLKRIIIKSEDPLLERLVGRYEDIIKEKAKVNEILSIGVDEEWDEMDLKVHPNRNAIGKSYRQWSSRIELMLRKRPAKEIKKGIETGEYSLGIDGHILEIQPNMVEFEKKVPEGFIEKETDGGFIYLDLDIDPKIWYEQIANEIRLRIKSMKREFDLKEGDEIEVYIDAPEDMIKAVKRHLGEIAEELHIRKTHYGSEETEEAEYVLEWDINGEPIDIGVTPLYKTKVIDIFRSIPGMSKEKAKMLYNEGYTKLEKLMKASASELSSIDGVKRSLARRIVQVVKQRGKELEQEIEKKEEDRKETTIPQKKKEEVIKVYMDTNGIGAAKSRKIYRSGYKKLEDIVEADLEDLSQKSNITIPIAKRLKRKVEVILSEGEKEIPAEDRRKVEIERKETPKKVEEKEIEEETVDESEVKEAEVDEGVEEVEVSEEQKPMEEEIIEEKEGAEKEEPEEEMEREKEEKKETPSKVEEEEGEYNIIESQGEEVCNVCGGKIQEGSNMVTCDCGENYHIQCGVKAGECSECSTVFKDDLQNFLTYDLPEDIFKSTTYLMKEEDGDGSMQIFKDILKSGMDGMLVTRQYPKKVKKKHGLQDVSMMWLSSVDRDNAVRPKNLEKFSLSIEQFLSKKEGSILLYGFEYLISNNDFDTVLHLIQSLKDQVAVNESILIISVNPKTMDEHDIDVLETEVDRVLT